MADPQLVPVDHDPFAAAAPSLIPVEGDPFSTAAPNGPIKVINTGKGAAAYDPGQTGVDWLQGMVRSIDKGATFGLSDKIAAAGDATAGWLGNQISPPQQNLADVIAGKPANPSWSDIYHERIKGFHGAEDKFWETNPGSDVVGQGAGMLSTAAALPVKGATLLARVIQGGKIGAGAGAASGFSSTNDTSLGEDLKATGIGAAGGAVLGAAAPAASAGAGSLLNWVGQRFGMTAPLQSKAFQQIAARIQSSTDGMGPGAQDMLDAVNAGHALNKPVMLADVGGEPVKGLAEQLANTPGAPRQIAKQALEARDAGAGARLGTNIDEGIMGAGGGQISAYDMNKGLQQAKETAAAPLWDKFYSSPPIDPEVAQGTLANLMQRPSMKDAAARALSIAKEEGRDPNEMGMAFDPSGQPFFQKVPSWQTLDYVKRGLDDVLNTYRDKVTGRLNLDEQGRAVLGTLNQYRGLMVKENPVYGQALDAWSGPSGAQTGMKMGQNFLNRSPGEGADNLAGLSASDKEFYKLGSSDALKTSIAKTGAAGDEARKLVGNDYLKQQLRPLFTDDAAYNHFIDSATAESQMFATKTDMIGNSRSAYRLAEQAHSAQGTGILAPLIEGAAAAGAGGAGGVILGGKAAIGLTSQLANYINQASPAVKAAMSKILYNPNHGENVAALARLMTTGVGNRPPLASVPLASMAGRVYPAISGPPTTAPQQ